MKSKINPQEKTPDLKKSTTGQLQQMQYNIETVISWLKMHQNELERINLEIRGELITKNQQNEKEHLQHNKGQRTAV